MTAVAVEWFKWPENPYRRMPMTRLGRDDQGTWLFAPKGTTTWFATSGTASLPVNFITLVPAGDQWWLCTWMSSNPDVDTDFYVDIVHPPLWTSESRVEVIDLDLDVIRYRDGRVVLDDEDEFKEHSISLAYPPDVIASARGSGQQVLDFVTKATPPFAAPPDRWLEAAASLATETS